MKDRHRLLPLGSDEVLHDEEHGHAHDNDSKMSSVYKKLVHMLYETFMTKELPGVSDPLAKQAITGNTRMTYATDWVDLEKM